MKHAFVCVLSALTTVLVSSFFTGSPLARTSGDRPPVGARPEGPAASTDLRRDPAVCCRKGTRSWKTTGLACKRAGGKPVSAAFCKPQRRTRTDRPLGARPGGPKVSPGLKPGVPVCCRKGAKKWMTVVGNCKRDGGRMVPQHLCERDTCCHVAGGNPFLTTGNKCAQRRGSSLPHTFCHGGSGREVCCRVAGVDLPGARGPGGAVYVITTKLKCRKGRGTEIDDLECARLGKYTSREVCCRTQVRVLDRTGPATYERKPLNKCRAPLSLPVPDRECTPEVDGNREVCCKPAGNFTELSTAPRPPYRTKKRLCHQARGKVVAHSECTR